MGRLRSYALGVLALGLAVVCMPVTGWSGDAPAITGPRIDLEHRDHHFGRVTQGKIVTHHFPFSNSGDADLVIDDVSTPCGCTAVLPDKSILAPGESSYVEVNYDSSARSGEVTRIITLLSNDAVEPELTLTVTATVDASMHAGFKAGVDLFGPKCGKCHATPNIGKMDQDLYDSACWFCHGKQRQGNTAPALRAFQAKDDDWLRQAITHGRPSTEMPGFGQSEGGPLDNTQIESLIRVLHTEPPPPPPKPESKPKPEPKSEAVTPAFSTDAPFFK